MAPLKGLCHLQTITQQWNFHNEKVMAPLKVVSMQLVATSVEQFP